MRRVYLALSLILCASIAAAQTLIPQNAGTNCSGSITTGGVAQQIVMTSTIAVPRHGYQIQNVSGDSMCFSELTTTPVCGTAGTWTLVATTGSYNTPANYVPGGPVFIIAATTGDKFTCVVW
jgi:hypothetical protein